ncbi:MAG: hypothetical protein QM742_09480 [Aquabacterium sp.]
MLEAINDYLQLGMAIQPAGKDLSAWPLLIATALIATLIIVRQSDD